MITTTKLDSDWEKIEPQKGKNIGRRADAEHPLDFFIGFDENEKMQLMLVSEFLPKLPDSSQQILVRGNQRVDGKYALCFTLADETLKDLYVSLCWDIMDSTIEIHDKNQGTKQTLKRFRMWQKMFAARKKTAFSETNAKGLIGELTTLERICIPKYGLETSISGWTGPLGTDRDFEYSDIWIESKATSLSTDAVTISSLDQLDVDSEGILAVSRIEKASPEAPQAVTLNQMIDRYKELLREDQHLWDSFSIRLALYGYDADSGVSSAAYIIHRIDQYAVKDDFPRIRRSLLPPAISNGKYEISISGISNWLISE